MWLYHSTPPGSSIVFKRLPFNGNPGGQECTTSPSQMTHACNPPTARPCKTLAPRRARAAWPTGNCSAEPFFNFRTWVCSCVATTTVQRTDKTGGYPRRVCRVSAMIVHAMTVAILWTVFSKTARPSVGYVVLNSFQHHLFPPTTSVESNQLQKESGGPEIVKSE